MIPETIVLLMVKMLVESGMVRVGVMCRMEAVRVVLLVECMHIMYWMVLICMVRRVEA